MPPKESQVVLGEPLHPGSALGTPRTPEKVCICSQENRGWNLMSSGDSMRTHLLAESHEVHTPEAREYSVDAQDDPARVQV